MTHSPSIFAAIVSQLIVWAEGWDELLEGPDPLYMRKNCH